MTILARKHSRQKAAKIYLFQYYARRTGWKISPAEVGALFGLTPAEADDTARRGNFLSRFNTYAGRVEAEAQPKPLDAPLTFADADLLKDFQL